MQVLINIPNEILDIILEYDGRIKYKNGQYVNIIHKKDPRYNIITPVISKKLSIMKKIEFCENGFYFEICIDICNDVGLVYDYNFSYPNKFEICYFDWRTDDIIQIRTYL